MSRSGSNAIWGLALGIGATAASGIYYWYNKLKANTPPREWRKVGTLSELYCYPLKSGGCIKPHFADCGLLGMHLGNIKDRMLMLVDNLGKVISVRSHPKMLKIQPTVEDDRLTLSAPGMEDLLIDFNAIAQGEMLKVKFYENDVFVVDTGVSYHKWFSKFLLDKDEGLKMVYYSYSVPTKPILSAFKNGIFITEDTGSLQDVSSYMLINQASVEELNTRLKDKVEALQFRPNFVIQTNGKPFDEDNWQWIRIGKKVIFRNIAPCYRCIIPNVNPITAERNPEGEPLKTLNKFRYDVKFKSPRMGLQLGSRVPGIVQKGDDVFVQSV